MGLILKKITLSVVLILWGLLYIFIEKAV